VRKRVIYLALLLLLAVSCVIISANLHEKEPLAKFITIETGYGINSCIDENGEIDVVVEFSSEDNPELYSQYCARLILSAVKRFPRDANDVPKEVTVRLYNKNTQQTFLRICVKGTRLLETSWDTLLEDQISNNVDYYYFNNKAY